jgi:hypothetical protein
MQVKERFAESLLAAGDEYIAYKSQPRFHSATQRQRTSLSRDVKPSRTICVTIPRWGAIECPVTVDAKGGRDVARIFTFYEVIL